MRRTGLLVALACAACAGPEPDRPRPAQAGAATHSTTTTATTAEVASADEPYDCCADVGHHRGRAEGFTPGPGELEWTARDGSVLVWVGYGIFLPGAQDMSARDLLDLSVDPFFVGKTEVTRGQYRAFCAATGRDLPAAPPTETDAHPVTGVDWADAAAYCAWAGLRLPTEAEWEFTAQGRGGCAYPWPTEPAQADGPWAVTADPAVLRSAPPPTGSAPAGAHPAVESSFGTLDQGGNVREWVSDWYAPYPPADRTGPIANPRGPESGAERVVRGGSWRTTDCRTGTRDHAPPETRSDDLGFRVACTPR